MVEDPLEDRLLILIRGSERHGGGTRRSPRTLRNFKIGTIVNLELCENIAGNPFE